MIYFKFSILNITVSIILLFIIAFFIIKKNYNTIIVIIRSFLAIILLLFSFEVAYKIPINRLKPKTAILIDTSYSMNFNDRLKKVVNFINSNLGYLKKNVDVSIYQFNESLLSVNDLSNIEVTKKITKIDKSLEDLVLSNKELYNILIFSDGINSSSNFPFLGKNKLNIIPVVWKEENFKDLSILRVRNSPIGFRNLVYNVNCDIYCCGYNNIEAYLYIYNMNTKEVVLEKNIKLNEGINKLNFEFVPKEIGKVNYKLKIHPQKNEITNKNNEYNFEVEIKKEQIRVLYICGKPSTEYYMLRNLIKNDMQIDLVSFVILRDQEDIIIVPDEDSSLIPFPTYDIFVKDLFNYDVLIFENFSYIKFGIPIYYLENIKKFVLQGGGFIMIGGNNSFFSGGYKNTPIEEILPIEMINNEKLIVSDIKPNYINYGNILLTKIFGSSQNKNFWESIPSFGNIQTVIARPQSQVILGYRTPQFDIPVFSYWNKGKGRVFTSSTNTTYRWVLGNMVSSKYNYKEFYEKFWKNIIYFCAGQEEFKNFFIVLDSNKHIVDDIMDIRVFLLDELNDADTKPELFVTCPDFNKIKLELKKVSGNQYLAQYSANMLGKYVFTGTFKKGHMQYIDTKKINVEESDFNEISILKQDLEYLSKLAAITGNVLFYIDGDIKDLLRLLEKKKDIDYSILIDLKNSIFLVFLFISLFLLEIFLVRYRR